jgi:hypothetical protein
MKIRNYEDWMEEDDRPIRRNKKVKPKKSSGEIRREWDDEHEPKRKVKQKKWKDK